MLGVNASVNLYMWHGGTNYGLTSGGQGGNMVNPSSYDYDAPQSECGKFQKGDIFYTVSQLIIVRFHFKYDYTNIKLYFYLCIFCGNILFCTI